MSMTLAGIDPVFIDLETRSCADLPEVGGWNYAKHPTTRLLTVSWSAEPDVFHLWLPGVGPDRAVPADYAATHLGDCVVHVGPQVPEELRALAGSDRPWCAHNAWTFDEPVWAATQPAAVPGAWVDTYPLALACGMPGGLNEISKRLWGEGKYEEGKKALLKASTSPTPDECDPGNVPLAIQVLVGKYNVQDVRLLRWLWDELVRSYDAPQSELDVLFAHRAVNGRGVRIDRKLLTGLIRLSDECKERAVGTIAELTGGFLSSLTDLNSRARVVKWMAQEGLDANKVLARNGSYSLARDLVSRFVEENSAAADRADEEGLTETPVDGATGVSCKTLQRVLKVLELRTCALRVTDGKLKAALQSLELCGPDDYRVKGMFVYHGAHCVSGDTEVLTPTGWLPINQWEGGPIAQWSQHDGSVRFLGAEANRFVTDEPTVTLDSPYGSGVFTLGHKIPTYNTYGTFVERPAGWMPSVAQASLPISGTMIGEGAITADQMRVLVAVQADGHWVTDPGQGRGLQFTFRKQRKIDRIGVILRAVGVPYRVQEFPSCPGQFRVSVRWADLPPWLTPERKTFGPWLLDSTMAAREAMMTEIQHWDGHYGGARTNVEYYSSEPTNHEWVATIAHLTGRAMLAGTDKASRLRETDRTQVRKTHWTNTGPLPEVFCPTTQTGYWMYRHNGKIGVTGNTGRWTARRIQLHNLPKPKEGINDIAGGGVWELFRLFEAGQLTFDAVAAKLDPKARFLTPDDAVSAMMRSILVPDAGRVLAAADFAAIECRVLAWLAGEEWLLNAFWDGTDPYLLTAERIFGPRATWPPCAGGIKKHPYRQVGKVVELGSGYGLGQDRFKLYAAGSNIDLEAVDTTPQVCIEAYRDSHPAISGPCMGTYKGRKWYRDGYWDHVQEAAIHCCATNDPVSVGRVTFYRRHGNLLCELPSGRKLVYRGARVQEERDGYGRLKPTLKYVSPRFGLTYTYGGKLVENIVQAVSRDILAAGIVRLERAGMPVVLHVHDEIGASIPAGDVPRFMELVTECPDWLTDFPLAAEGSGADRYAKTPPPGVKDQTYRNGRPL